MEKEDNYLIFENDDEFADFVFAPFAQIERNNKGLVYVNSGDYSEDYLRCLEQEIIFVIKQANSAICRRGVAIKRLPIKSLDGSIMSRMTTGQLEVKNVMEWYDYEFMQRIKEKKRQREV